jgi:hypothetical protein
LKSGRPRLQFIRDRKERLLVELAEEIRQMSVALRRPFGLVLEALIEEKEKD